MKKAGFAPVDNGRIVISSESGVTADAIVIDNRSNDFVFVPAVQLDSR